MFVCMKMLICIISGVCVFEDPQINTSTLPVYVTDWSMEMWLYR